MSGAVADLLTPQNPLTRSPSQDKDRSNRTSLERKVTSDVQAEAPARPSPRTTGSTTTRPRNITNSFQKLVFCDPVAFRYLEEDPATVVIDRRRRLEGYEIFVVEQWACSRTHPTFVITTYTGDASHSILVNVLGVPRDEETWSPRLKLYFQAISQFHAKERETPLGTLMVTNLSAFPSTLTVIPVPDGDTKKHKDDFIVNENLKRMNCSGRGAVNLQRPQTSTIDKFHQLYKISESIALYQSVMELVKVCQIALVIYDKLEIDYADGLLCDITEKALGDWWTEIGTYFYNIDPSDGVMGPTTVAAVLGLLIGAYNRLKTSGAPVGKDVLDLAAMKRAIGHFQKSSKMEKTRRLDRETLDRLHRATAKSASGEGWKVPKAVKSTVADLSGKGGEMVLGIVGGREKAGISEAETLDIDRLAQLVTGQKMRWLWQGRPMKSVELMSPAEDDLNGKVFSIDDQGGFIWARNKRDSVQEPVLERSETMSSQMTQEGRSGLGRIREAVGGLKGHSQRSHRDGDVLDVHDEAPTTPRERPTYREHYTRSRTSQDVLHPAMDMALAKASPDATKRNSNTLKPVRSSVDSEAPSHREQLRRAVADDSPRKKKIKADMADMRGEFDSAVYQNFSAAFRYDGPQTNILKRSRSAVQVVPPFPEMPRQNRLNRQLSFSLVESTILTYRDIVSEDDDKGIRSERPVAAMAAREVNTITARMRARRILRIQQASIPFAESRVEHVEHLDHDAQQHLEELNNLYYQKLEEYQVLRATSSDVVSQEKGSLTEGVRRVEMLGAKLDYELNALQSRMQEVEDGADEFERNVQIIEARVQELAGSEEHHHVPWIARILNFFGSSKEESSWLF